MQTYSATGLLAAAGRTSEGKSKATWVANRVVVREALTAGLLGTGLAALIAPEDLGLSIAPHPVWAIVLVLAARYGTRGLVLALGSVWGSMALATAIAGIGMEKLADVWTSGANLGTGVVTIVIGWVAAVHERRTNELMVRLAELERRSSDETAGVAKLRDAAVSLRARADRLDYSLAFLSDVAGRLDGSDPVAGAEAALALALARSGARAGIVQMAERGRLRTIACHGAWSADMPLPPDVLHDKTSTMAWESGTVVRVGDLPEKGPHDSDIAAAIRDENGERVGVVALRGVPADSLRPAGTRDLELIARWCGKSLSARGTVRPEVAAAVRQEMLEPAPSSVPPEKNPPANAAC